MILQPKRWQRAEDPRYDPIRHRQWFARLLKRKHIIPMMEGCYQQWVDMLNYEDTTPSQKKLCELWNVSCREFRDFAAFRNGATNGTSKTFRAILDGAYHLYCEHNAIHPIQRFIEDVAPLYGVKSRQVWEHWEIDPHFYPSDYAYPRN